MSDEARSLVFVVAWAHRQVIGHQGSLPWHMPEDLRHFREVTLGHVVLMGRRTFESIGRPLPKRFNLVVSRHRPPVEREDLHFVSSLEEALKVAWERDPAPRVIGGAEIYRQLLPQMTELYLSEIDREVEGDAYFPPVDLNPFVEGEEKPAETPGLRFRHFRRNPHFPPSALV